MAKITKREYNKEMTAINARFAEAEATVKRCIEEAGDGVWPEGLGDICNAAHDAAWQGSEDIKLLEHRWSTRYWSGADWSSWDLITSNID
jgi:hypothetical protein